MTLRADLENSLADFVFDEGQNENDVIGHWVDVFGLSPQQAIDCLAAFQEPWNYKWPEGLV